MPLDVNFGFALQFGRPFNPPWRTLDELVERETLEHELRALDRRERRALAIRSTKTLDETEDVEAEFAREQAADDRGYDQTLKAARRRMETELAELNRFYVQLSASMLVAAAVSEAVGVESLLTQTVDRSGERAVASFHAGAEAGVLPKLLKVRVGSYIEPTRFDGSSARVHGTVGLDVKLVRWDVFGLWPEDYLWRLGLGGDFAERYATWSFMIGGWYPRHDAPLPTRPCP